MGAEEDNRLFDDIIEREMFVELLAGGVCSVNAGIQVGWTPSQTKRNLSDPGFKELVEAALERADGSIEEALYAIAKRGNLGAIQMWLLNRQPDRWRDVKRIEIKNDVTVSVGMIEAVKRGALDLLREQGVMAMQALDSGEIIDAEVIE